MPNPVARSHDQSGQAATTRPRPHLTVTAASGPAQEPYQAPAPRIMPEAMAKRPGMAEKPDGPGAVPSLTFSGENMPADGKDAPATGTDRSLQPSIQPVSTRPATRSPVPVSAHAGQIADKGNDIVDTDADIGLDTGRDTGLAAAPNQHAATMNTARSSPLPLTPATLRPDMVRDMAVLLHRSANGDFEIDLRPEELGRVRMSMRLEDAGGISVVISADRTAAQELMRRHADLLMNELQSLGYESIDIAFSDHRDESPRESRPARPAADVPGGDEPATVSPRAIHVAEENRLDLRI